MSSGLKDVVLVGRVEDNQWKGLDPETVNFEHCKRALIQIATTLDPSSKEDVVAAIVKGNIRVSPDGVVQATNHGVSAYLIGLLHGCSDVSKTQIHYDNLSIKYDSIADLATSINEMVDKITGGDKGHALWQELSAISEMNLNPRDW